MLAGVVGLAVPAAIAGPIVGRGGLWMPGSARLPAPTALRCSHVRNAGIRLSQCSRRCSHHAAGPSRVSSRRSCTSGSAGRRIVGCLWADARKEGGFVFGLVFL